MSLVEEPFGWILPYETYQPNDRAKTNKRPRTSKKEGAFSGHDSFRFTASGADGKENPHEIGAKKEGHEAMAGGFKIVVERSSRAFLVPVLSLGFPSVSQDVFFLGHVWFYVEYVLFLTSHFLQTPTIFGFAMFCLLG